MNTSMRWIGSGGGPLLLVPASLVRSWRGYDRSDLDPLDPSHDYGRACAVTEEIEPIQIGPGRGLVLGDAPDITTWIASNSREGLLVRWHGADSEAHLLGTLPSDDVWRSQSEILCLVNKDRELLLFDSAYGGEDIERTEYLTIPLDPGMYAVQSLWWTPVKATCSILHRLSFKQPAYSAEHK